MAEEFYVAVLGEPPKELSGSFKATFLFTIH